MFMTIIFFVRIFLHEYLDNILDSLGDFGCLKKCGIFKIYRLHNYQAPDYCYKKVALFLKIASFKKN